MAIIQGTDNPVVLTGTATADAILSGDGTLSGAGNDQFDLNLRDCKDANAPPNTITNIPLADLNADNFLFS